MEHLVRTRERGRKVKDRTGRSQRKEIMTFEEHWEEYKREMRKAVNSVAHAETLELTTTREAAKHAWDRARVQVPSFWNPDLLKLRTKAENLLFDIKNLGTTEG